MASDSLVVRTYRSSESNNSSKPEKSDRSEEFQIYQGVMGKPGVDFPTYANIPATSFSCRKVKKSGYYADLATDCQVFHVCDGNRKISFLCPNGTIFRQSHLICDWWFRVDCGKSEELYDESAEQLEADQKIYKARAQERERKKKLSKTLAAENGGEVTSSEVFGLVDTFKTDSPPRTIENTNFYARTPKYPSSKSERYPNKNPFGNNDEASLNRYKGKETEKITESKEINFPSSQSKISYSNNRKSSILASDQKSSTLQSSQHIIQTTQNSIDSSIFKENIQGAESGSLVEDLANRSKNRHLGSIENKETNEFNSRKNSEYEEQKITYRSKVSNNREKNKFKSGERFDLLNEGRQTTFGTTERLNSNNFYNQKSSNLGQGKKENAEYNTHQTYQNNNQKSDGKENYQNVNFPYSNDEINRENVHLEKGSKNSNNAYSNDEGIIQQYNNYKGSEISETTVGTEYFSSHPSSQFSKTSNVYNPSFTDYTTSGTTDYDNGLKSTRFEYKTSQRPQNFQSNLKGQNNFTYFNNYKDTAEISGTGNDKNAVEFVSNTNLTTSQNFNFDKSTVSNNFFEYINTPQNGRENVKTETTSYGGNINFNYNNNKDNLWFGYHGDRTIASPKNKEEGTEKVNPTYTTENFNYDEKRTSTFVIQETVLPTTQTRKNHSSKLRTSTATYDEHIPFFESNREGKSYSDVKDHFQTQNKNVFKTTHRNSVTANHFSTRAPLSEEEYSTVTEFFKTTFHWPVKKNSKKVTFLPGTEAQNFFPTTKFQTTFPKYYETTTTNIFNADEIYFTTQTPEKEVEHINEFSTIQDGTTKFNEKEVSTAKSDIDITLQELDITKTTTVPNEKNKTYEDYIRQGLEVPPSLGPNAIRSFALYYGINNGTESLPTTTYEPITSTLDVIRQVNDLIYSSLENNNEQKINSREDLLPNSLLTQHTKTSYSALFSNSASENQTTATEFERKEETSTSLNVGTTNFDSFTEEPFKINTELRKNDLDSSQSRGLVEPDPYSEEGSTKSSPDLRELAQVFTKALSAYLDDPEAFRKVLSEIRPTEPALDVNKNGDTVQYPSAVKEDGEVLDFSDVTKSLYTKKTELTTSKQKETTKITTEALTTETSIANEVENLILPYNNLVNSTWATNIELTAPLLESLDQSQSSYYTPPPVVVGTTNAIAEEINKFIEKDKSSITEGNNVVDSYFPLSTESNILKYGGFQNNSRGTTKYSPYGSDLTFSSGASSFITNASTVSPKVTEILLETSTSFYDDFSKNRTEKKEIQLAKELNNLILLPKFTTPRPTSTEFTTSVPNLSTYHNEKNEVSQYRDINLGNGEILETNIPSRAGKALQISEGRANSYFNPAVQEINLELGPQSTTPKGFLITYSLQASSDSQPATYLPKETIPTIIPTTYSRGKNFFSTTTDPFLTTIFRNLEETSDQTNTQNKIENDATTSQTSTQSFVGSTKSLDRITELQETLMFNTSYITGQQKNQARESVQEIMGNLNMTESTAEALMKVMEMAAKNDTYRRLVLLLVNDKSGKNKTAEETRISLLKALLTPVISVQQTRTNIPIPDPLKLAQVNPSRSESIRRSKSIRQDSRNNKITTLKTSPTTLPPTTVTRPKNIKRTKTSRNRVDSNYRKTELGNLGTIKRTIENSRSKQVKLNSVDDAILSSDSRAVELLRSLYSLAARWG